MNTEKQQFHAWVDKGINLCFIIVFYTKLNWSDLE